MSKQGVGKKVWTIGHVPFDGDTVICGPSLDGTIDVVEKSYCEQLEKEKAAMLAVLKTWYACNCNRTSSCLVEICGFKAKQIVEEIEKLGGGKNG